jgi:hypothetical protein
VLRNSLILYGDEVMRIVEMTPSPFKGVTVAWRVIARTMKGS